MSLTALCHADRLNNSRRLYCGPSEIHQIMAEITSGITSPKGTSFPKEISDNLLHPNFYWHMLDMGDDVPVLPIVFVGNPSCPGLVIDDARSVILIERGVSSEGKVWLGDIAVAGTMMDSTKKQRVVGVRYNSYRDCVNGIVISTLSGTRTMHFVPEEASIGAPVTKAMIGSTDHNYTFWFDDSTRTGQQIVKRQDLFTCTTDQAMLHIQYEIPHFPSHIIESLPWSLSVPRFLQQAT